MTEKLDPIEFARMRRQMADEWERLMWQLLRNRQRCNQKFRREHPLGIYTADFYCVDAKLVIEVDGASHQSKPTLAPLSPKIRTKMLSEVDQAQSEFLGRGAGGEGKPT